MYKKKEEAILNINEIILESKDNSIKSKITIKKEKGGIKYDCFELIKSETELLVDQSIYIKKGKFDSIISLINKIDENQIRDEMNLSGFDGDFYTLSFGDGINFKRYSLWNPYSQRKKHIKWYTLTINKIRDIFPNKKVHYFSR